MNCSMAAKLGKLVLSLPMPAPVKEQADRLFDIVDPGSHISVDKLIVAANEHKADAILISLGLPFNAESLPRLPSTVKVIAWTSVGFDHIDLAAGDARGITVVITPDVVTDATADITMLLI